MTVGLRTSIGGALVITKIHVYVVPPATHRSRHPLGEIKVVEDKVI